MSVFYHENDEATRLAIGLMSGTSADGVDAALIEITASGVKTKACLKAFCFIPFSDEARSTILRVAAGGYGGSAEVCKMNFWLGELFADACVKACDIAGVAKSDIAFIGSHGQTIFHAPIEEDYLGRAVRSTLQIGEASVIAQRMGCPVVSDFRVRDIAGGGLGAPLVPYTEYLLYRSESRNVALQNIGGIGNITVLPKACALNDIIAFDTGPGNMVMDALAAILTNGNARYDKGGALAARGSISKELLEWLMQDEYLKMPPPKTTGREVYGEAFVNKLLARAKQTNVSVLDTLTTATRFTAECIKSGIDSFCTVKPETLIVGGGGSLNPTLLEMIKDSLTGCKVVTNEEIGLDSSAKEAIAFAVLANETLHGRCNNAPSATGCMHSVVMGKISI